MQGRLSNPVNNMIQAFPWDDWENEFKIANEISVNLMEWTLDDYKIFDNPIMNTVGRKKIKYLRKVIWFRFFIYLGKKLFKPICN